MRPVRSPSNAASDPQPVALPRRSSPRDNAKPQQTQKPPTQSVVSKNKQGTIQTKLTDKYTKTPSAKRSAQEAISPSQLQDPKKLHITSSSRMPAPLNMLPSIGQPTLLM